MPAHKHRLKTLRQANKSQARNTQVKSRIKTLTKNVESADSPETAEKALKATVSAIDKAAKKGVIHKRAAARRISRITRKANKKA
jgi:small subunit ribosomal protein S20